MHLYALDGLLGTQNSQMLGAGVAAPLGQRGSGHLY